MIGTKSCKKNPKEKKKEFFDFLCISNVKYPYQIVDFGCRSIGVAKIAGWKRSREVGKGDLSVMIIDH